MYVGTRLASAMLAAGDALYNGGTLVGYSSARPATPETALNATPGVLFTFTFSSAAFSAPAFASTVEQALAAFAASSVVASGGGTVMFLRAFDSSGNPVGADYSVGATGATGVDVTFASTTIVANTNVQMTSFYNQILNVS